MATSHSNQEYLEAGQIFKGETAEELAEQIGIDPATLANTVAKYNAFCEAGEDTDFHRGTDVYSAFNYGAQGEEAMRVDGTPVSRLYAAGEMGTIYSYNYNGGGNVSEAMSSGRLAARSIDALESWE